jgi:hypothetical protein
MSLEETKKFFEEKKSVLERLMNFKQWKFYNLSERTYTRSKMKASF